MQTLVDHATDVDKAQFYKKTYGHVALAILAFIFVESLLIKFIPEEYIFMMISQKYTWLLIIGAFWLSSILASKWTLSQSKSTQYMGLGFFVLMESIIFLPLIYIAASYSGLEVIYQAAVLSLALFAGITVYALTSKKDFSFMRTALIVGGFISIGLIIAGAIFGFTLGLWFSVGMAIFASAAILYETSKLKHTYGTEQYVGASMQLFASVMLLFWYILSIFSSRD